MKELTPGTMFLFVDREHLGGSRDILWYVGRSVLCMMLAGAGEDKLRFTALEGSSAGSTWSGPVWEEASVRPVDPTRWTRGSAPSREEVDRAVRALENDDGMPCGVQRALAPLGDWYLLLGCTMLNKTTRRAARRALADMLRAAPGPEAFLAKCLEDDSVLDILQPCGLASVRFARLVLMTTDYLRGADISYIFGVGKYASDSYEIFILGRTLDPASVSDYELKRYLSDRVREEIAGRPDQHGQQA